MTKVKQLFIILMVVTSVIAFTTNAYAQPPSGPVVEEDKGLLDRGLEVVGGAAKKGAVWAGGKIDAGRRATLEACAAKGNPECIKFLRESECQPLAIETTDKLRRGWDRSHSLASFWGPPGYHMVWFLLVCGTFLLIIGNPKTASKKRKAWAAGITLFVALWLHLPMWGVELGASMGNSLSTFKTQCPEFDVADLATKKLAYDDGGISVAWDKATGALSLFEKLWLWFLGWTMELVEYAGGFMWGVCGLLYAILIARSWSFWKTLWTLRDAKSALFSHVLGTLSLETADLPEDSTEQADDASEEEAEDEEEGDGGSGAKLELTSLHDAHADEPARPPEAERPKEADTGRKMRRSRVNRDVVKCKHCGRRNTKNRTRCVNPLCGRTLKNK